jgi:hypothetical protein
VSSTAPRDLKITARWAGEDYVAQIPRLYEGEELYLTARFYPEIRLERQSVRTTRLAKPRFDISTSNIKLQSFTAALTVVVGVISFE